MLIFQPQRPRVVYSKQYLHTGEEEYFMPGEGQVFIECEDCRIAPAIYYESSVEQHSKVCHVPWIKYTLLLFLILRRG